MPHFERMTREVFKTRVDNYPWKRSIIHVDVHHTWRPNHAQWQGEKSMRGMYHAHVVDRGFSDIAQHATIDPTGGIWSGRDWNKTPASMVGYNGNSRKGPFMFEMVGDFDRERDQLVGAQLTSALFVTSYILYKFNLPTKAIRFHRDYSDKTCPGSAIDYKVFCGLINEFRESNGLK